VADGDRDRDRDPDPDRDPDLDRWGACVCPPTSRNL